MCWSSDQMGIGKVTTNRKSRIQTHLTEFVSLQASILLMYLVKADFLKYSPLFGHWKSICDTIFPEKNGTLLIYQKPPPNCERKEDFLQLYFYRNHFLSEKGKNITTFSLCLINQDWPRTVWDHWESRHSQNGSRENKWREKNH
jgi:hypothetical protein